MVLNILDLPDEILLKIFNYINNIREKIRLASVSSQFYSLVSEACRTQNYRLVQQCDYMYEDEMAQVDLQEPIVKMNELLHVASKLTHFVDRVYHFEYGKQSGTELERRDHLSLIHVKYMYLDLCRAYFFGKPYEKSFDQKIQTVLANIPEISVLHIRADKDYNFEFSVMQNLKEFRLDYFETKGYQNFQNSFPPHLIGLLNGYAPNLEEFIFSSQYIDICLNFHLPKIIKILAENCHSLRSIQIRLAPFNEQVHYISRHMTFDDKNKLLRLEYLDIQGAVFSFEFWEQILKLTPNLKFIAFDRKTYDDIENLIAKFCPRAKYDKNKPCDILVEYSSQKTTNRVY